MSEVKYLKNDKDAFAIEENGQRIAEMIVSEKEGILSIFHTGVEPPYKGRGLGKKLVEAMIEHARANHLKVDAHCPFVKEQIKDHPEKFTDIALAS